MSDEQEDWRREAYEAGVQSEIRRQDLLWALRSRVLTDAEMQQVCRRGPVGMLVARRFNSHGHGWYDSYNQREVESMFSDLLVAQFRMRCIAAQAIRGEL